MSRILHVFLVGVVQMAVLAWGTDGPGALQLRVVEGDGASYVIASRATRGVTVQVSDGDGRPVEGAIVSFLLPGEGPGGTFTSGSRTEIVNTRADGRAAVWGMRWNRTAGEFAIRVTAVKGPARATISVGQNLVGSAAEARAASAGVRRRAGSHKALLITLAVAGAAAGAVAGVAGGRGTTTAAPAAAAVATTTIGTPTIFLGRP